MTPVLLLSLAGLFLSIALITGVGIQLVFFGRTSAQRRVAGGMEAVAERGIARAEGRGHELPASHPSNNLGSKDLRQSLLAGGSDQLPDGSFDQLPEPDLFDPVVRVAVDAYAQAR